MAHVVARHVRAFAIKTKACVRDTLEHMAPLDATATVSYAHGLRNAYKKDYGTKDCFRGIFIYSMSAKSKPPMQM